MTTKYLRFRAGALPPTRSTDLLLSWRDTTADVLRLPTPLLKWSDCRRTHSHNISNYNWLEMDLQGKNSHTTALHVTTLTHWSFLLFHASNIQGQLVLESQQPFVPLLSRTNWLPFNYSQKCCEKWWIMWHVLYNTPTNPSNHRKILRGFKLQWTNRKGKNCLKLYP